MLAFLATAAIDARPLFLLYPLVVGLRPRWRSGAARTPAARRAGLQRDDLGHRRRREPGVVYVALASFPIGLPGPRAVQLSPRLPVAPLLASEDRANHFPIEDPNVSGLPLPTTTSCTCSAAHQVTGLALPLILFRLYLLPLIALGAIQLVVAGRASSRSSTMRRDRRRVVLPHQSDEPDSDARQQ
ncbi:MAG: hypothetical protein R2695_08560 [Acidimicrobiales bacterium]